jgi:hypothetical protein
MIKYASNANNLWSDPNVKCYTDIRSFITALRAEINHRGYCLFEMQPGDATRYCFFAIQEPDSPVAVIGQSEGHAWAETVASGGWFTPDYIQGKGCREWTASLLAEVLNRLSDPKPARHYYDFEKSCPIKDGVPIR